MKKLLSLILALCMLLTLAACAGEPAETTPSTEAPTAAPTAPSAQDVTYTYDETNPMGLTIAWTLTLKADGTYTLTEVNDFVGEVSYEGASYTVDGSTVTCGAMASAPAISEWALAEGFTATVDGETFAPVVAAAGGVEAGTYTYEETNPMGLSIQWTLVLNEDGTYVLTEVNDFVGEVSYEGAQWYSEGSTVTCGAMASAPAISDWAKAEGFTATVDGETFAPGAAEGGDSSVAGPIGDAGGESSDADHASVEYAAGSDAQVCDIYLPEGVEKAPIIVLVHGGGFMFGDQGMDVILPVIDKALEKGYAVVSVDYRKSSEAVFPAALGDVKAAVRFVKAYAMDYGWNPEKIAIWGESAGAYLSLMTALTPDVAELNADVTDYDKIPSDVTALVSFYAPVEFYTLYEEAGKPDSAASSFESKFLGQDITADKDATYKTYWETYADSIPTDLMAWIQAGDSDQKVPHTQSVNFAQRLANYIPAENIQHSIIAGADHEDDAFYTDENLDAVFAWLDGFMKG